MRFNLADPIQVKAARNRLTYLKNKRRFVDIKEIFPSRSTNQNSYLHLILADFGVHFGYTLEEAKLIYKELNREIYYYTKKGRTFIRSSAKLNKDEMARTIDRFIEITAEQGYTLPPANNQDWMMQAENNAEKKRRFL